MPAPTPLTGRADAPTSRGQGPFRWLASEWGIALLALVLAFLVWAVVWGNISDPAEITVRLEPHTSSRFVAFHDGNARVLLQGPRAELEEARQKIGDALVVNLADLPPGKDHERVSLADGELFAFPFPRRLVQSVSVVPERIEVYRWKETQVRYVAPEVRGVPAGIGYDVILDPPASPLSGPAGKIGETIQGDPLDVADLFAQVGSGILPPDAERRLTFDAWRDDSESRRYRTDVELPPVQARVRFHFTGRQAIRNRIEFRHPAGFEVSAGESPDPDVVQGYYTGRFEGAAEDLRVLEERSGEWWFVVRIPADKLPADENDLTVDLPVEFVSTQALGSLRVSFVERATMLLVIRRSAP